MVKKQWVDFVQGGAEPQPRSLPVPDRRAGEVGRAASPRSRTRSTATSSSSRRSRSTPERLDRIKSHQRYAFALGLDTPGAASPTQAAQAIAITGDVDALNQRFAAYQKVTPADIQRVARAIFQPQNETS